MNFHTTTRVPVDDEYAGLIGKAVYIFAYYEWTIIWIIEYLENGFVSQYCRGGPMTSGNVGKHFRSIIDNLVSEPANVTKAALESCLADFSGLVIKRNALIHAHPCTDEDGSQILNYQTKPSKPLSDMKWPSQEVKSIISEIDKAACSAGEILDQIRE